MNGFLSTLLCRGSLLLSSYTFYLYADDLFLWSGSSDLDFRICCSFDLFYVSLPRCSFGASSCVHFIYPSNYFIGLIVLYYLLLSYFHFSVLYPEAFQYLCCRIACFSKYALQILYALLSLLRFVVLLKLYSSLWSPQSCIRLASLPHWIIYPKWF